MLRRLLKLFGPLPGELPDVINKPLLTDAPNSRYSAGQVWAFDTPPGQEGAVVIILKVEGHARLGTIVHVAVRGAKLQNPLIASGVQDCLPHTPMAERALDRSVTRLLRENESPPEDFRDGYAAWREEFNEGKAASNSALARFKSLALTAALERRIQTDQVKGKSDDQS